jgi:hypothetical protein
MVSGSLAAMEAFLMEQVGPSIKNRIWQSPAEEPKYAGLPRIIVEDGGGQRTLTSETVVWQDTVSVRCEDRGRDAATALGKTVYDLFPDDPDEAVPRLTVPGATVTWCRVTTTRGERVMNVRPEDGDWRYAAILTFSVRTERPRAGGD